MKKNIRFGMLSILLVTNSVFAIRDGGFDRPIRPNPCEGVTSVQFPDRRHCGAACVTRHDQRRTARKAELPGLEKNILNKISVLNAENANLNTYDTKINFINSEIRVLDSRVEKNISLIKNANDEKNVKISTLNENEKNKTALISEMDHNNSKQKFLQTMSEKFKIENKLDFINNFETFDSELDNLHMSIQNQSQLSEIALLYFTKKDFQNKVDLINDYYFSSYVEDESYSVSELKNLNKNYKTKFNVINNIKAIGEKLKLELANVDLTFNNLQKINDELNKKIKEFKEVKIPEIQKQIKEQDSFVYSTKIEIEKIAKLKQEKIDQVNDINKNYKTAAIARRDAANTLKIQAEAQLAAVKGYIDHHNSMTDGSGCFARNPILSKSIGCGRIEEYCGVNPNVSDID